MALYDLIVNVKSEVLDLDKIHLSKTNRIELKQLLKEFKHLKRLEEFNLPVDNKLLLFGHTGCGKTTTAKAIAKYLNKKIIILNLGGIVDSRLGQTAKNVTEVFKKASRENSVLFLDEFDYIGKIRDYDNKDSGEMKRLVNTVIQLIDQLPSQTLLIAATNNSKIIDTALLRRFQLKLEFIKPSNNQLDAYYDTLITQFPKEFRSIGRKYNLSYAEAKDVAFRAIKNNIVNSIEESELTKIEQDESIN